MDVTAVTWVVAVVGLVLIAVLGSLQLVAVVRPRAKWTIQQVYGGDPDSTDPTAYFAYNQGYAQADVFFWVPIQIVGSVGMLLGRQWGFLLALAASIPYLYTAITIYTWDRDLGFRQNTATYWVLIWGIWPAFGLLQAIYSFLRLIE